MGNNVRYLLPKYMLACGAVFALTIALAWATRQELFVSADKLRIWAPFGFSALALIVLWPFLARLRTRNVRGRNFVAGATFLSMGFPAQYAFDQLHKTGALSEVPLVLLAYVASCLAFAASIATFQLKD